MKLHFHKYKKFYREYWITEHGDLSKSVYSKEALSDTDVYGDGIERIKVCQICGKKKILPLYFQ